MRRIAETHSGWSAHLFSHLVATRVAASCGNHRPNGGRGLGQRRMGRPGSCRIRDARALVFDVPTGHLATPTRPRIDALVDLPAELQQPLADADPSAHTTGGGGRHGEEGLCAGV